MSFPVIYIMGVSGSGKTTIGQKLAATTGIPFFDADDWHPPANKEKMRSGQPLSDEDRKEWLIRLNELARKQSLVKGAIIACSALKEKYRVVLAHGIKGKVFWVLLQGSFELIHERMSVRKDHFMPPGLLRSQFDILEVPEQAIIVDIGQEPEQIVNNIIKETGLYKQ